MSKPRILIGQIKNVGDIKGWNLKGIESCKKKIFGYTENMPGEKNWIKPLLGKSMQNYYFPSKYLHLDFNLKEYMRMQTVRFQKKETDDSLMNLQKCINLIVENKDKVEKFLRNIPKELYFENQSLKDFYSLYLTIFPADKHNHSLSPDDLKELNLGDQNFTWFNRSSRSASETQTDKSNFSHTDFYTQKQNENENDESTPGKKMVKKKVLHKEEGQNMIPQKECEKISSQMNHYKKIIFTRTKGKLLFKRIILGNNQVQGDKMAMRLNKQKEENASGEKLYYVDCDVNIGLEERREKCKKEVDECEKSKKQFINLLSENESLRKTFWIRNRFIDPLYLRRRYSFIDKLTKKKIKKEKYKTYRKHFIQHADEKQVWPDNKGLLNKVYPNPYS
ncbi:hypothetical protein, conserved [Plasmodium gonderi]|uniref:Uncharacterized protein n=1 Tax=Plasmodium gonderi TaxID=77519 RepID=A0A1Y1JNG1_PLAGO|nr:hypothetical protein, conserved [Plasmodium gonderi]GAW83790.1 hypothetical protein, conserved [Plasmodium gonderi]